MPRSGSRHGQDPDLARGIVTPENLAELKIGASFFSPLERVKPGKLDFTRYGIVARSAGCVTKIGGALPNSQSIRARSNSTRMRGGAMPQSPVYEPHDLYRHEITKFVEPGEYWLPYGTFEDPATHWTNERVDRQKR